MGKKTGENKLVTVTLKQIENRVKKNNSLYGNAIDSFVDKSKKKGLKKGRARPKDPTEVKILSRFKRIR